MLNFFKRDPKKKLETAYAKKLEEARDAQRGGNMPLYATLSAEVEALGKEIDALDQG